MINIKDMRAIIKTIICAVAVVSTLVSCLKINDWGGSNKNIGAFSVSAKKKVYFSKGNLQASIDASGAITAWKFAARQYDLLPNGCNNYDKFGREACEFDTFRWSTTSNNYGLYDYRFYEEKSSGNFVDWGNAIGDGNTWRTLSNEEWVYLFLTRAASTVNRQPNARFAKASICDVIGIILLPDVYVHPAEVPDLNYINDLDKYGFGSNILDSSEWEKMESAGAVFLPRSSTNGGEISFWTSSAFSDSKAYYVSIVDKGLHLDKNAYGTRSIECYVRLVTDVK